MKRRLFNILVALSVVMSAALIAACRLSWAQTYGWPKCFLRPGLQVQLRTGRIFVIRLSGPLPAGVIAEINGVFVPGQPGEWGYNWSPRGKELNPRLPPHRWYMVRSGPQMPAGSLKNGLGFSYGEAPLDVRLAPGCTWQVCSIPMWCPALLSCVGMLPWFIGHLRRRRIRRRVKAGQCVACGYDLRAHQPGERCPECAELIPATGVKSNVP